jgi:hypothetical protein
MAIVVEEDKQQSRTPALLGGVVIVVILVAAAYYIFFAAPPTAIVTPPPNYAIIEPIAGISFNPSSVINSPAFRALQQLIPEPTSTGPSGVGRQNPFAGL